MMNGNKLKARSLRHLALLGLLGTLGACDDLLTVENPGAAAAAELDDPYMIPTMVHGVVGNFQSMYDDITFAGAILTDEGVNGHNFDQWKQFDLRVVTPDNSILLSEVYGPLQRSRGFADEVTGRVRKLLGDDAAKSLDFARVLVYGGYSYVMLGEYFCKSPVSETGKALSSEEILAEAIKRFDEAITVATAAKAAGVTAARADSLINMANVGAARASLWNGNTQAAIQYASAVPANFVAWVPFSTNTAYANNILRTATTGASRYLGVGPEFRGLNDPRVRHSATSTTGHNGLTLLFTPFQSPSHTEWNATTPAAFGLGTGIRFTSGLEAQYIVAEAQGPTAATLTFVNARRAVGRQAAVTLSGDALMRELRDQRRRDFFLDGHRLGDLRRYKARYGVDNFPSGAHPNESWGSYGDATCFIPHMNESIGNPNY